MVARPQWTAFSVIISLPLLLLTSGVNGAPSNTCSRTQLCDKVNQKGGEVDPASRLGRLITRSGMSIDEFKSQVCGIPVPQAEPPVIESEPEPVPVQEFTPEPEPVAPQPAAEESNPDPSPAPVEEQPQQAPDPAPAPSNGGGAASGDQQQYLDIHNSLRARHGAAPLSWDDGLAQEAQSWANGCRFEHSGPGENLAAGTGNGYGIADALGGWAAEEPDYNPATESGAGHYTQMVWKGTTKVGCAVAPACQGIFSDPAKYYVCEYSPPGNVKNNYAQNV